MRLAKNQSANHRAAKTSTKQSGHRALKSRFNYRERLFLIFAFVFSATLGFLFYKNLAETSAVHAAYAGFDAGNIINDTVMADYNSMSEADIYNFLKSKNSCNDTNLSKADGYWHLYYHVENGHFVCMADENFDGESASHIIWQAAQDYRINPKVLIVLLQKEQGLVTDTWPNASLQYRSATGYGCPDTAACDSQYYGFRNQVRNAAELFRYILNNGSAYYPVGSRSIKFNPSDSCGSSVVNIQNRATSALYQYTPYQPNDAVLNAGPGVVVNCGAYGNANFYYYYTQWFGSTQGKEIFGVYLPDGIYQMRTTSGLALSFDGTENGAGAKTENPNTGDTLQQFRISQAGKYYRFQNVRTGRYLDLSAAETYDGTKTQLWDGNDTCAQKWLLQNNEYGYRLISACASEANTKSLDVSAGGVGDVGTKIQLWTDNETVSQRWILTNLSSGPIDDNTYSIKSTSGKALTPASESPDNGTGMLIWEDSTSAANRFRVARNTDGTYRIQNTKTGFSIDVNGGSTREGASTQLWYNNDSCAQKWIAEKTGDKYIFKNSCSNKALDISGGATSSNNTRVQIWTNNSTDAQKWSLTSPSPPPITNGTYAINSVLGNGQRVDVAGGHAANNVNVQDWNRNGTDAQKFTFAYDSSTGYYSIQSVAAERGLDASNFGANGANVQVYDSNSGCPQRWIIIPTSNGQYYLASACTRNVIDVVGSNDQSGTNITVWELHGGNNQRWVIDSNTDIARGPIEDGAYLVTSALNSNLVLDVNGGWAADGTNIQTWSKNNTVAQKFIFTNDPATGNYSIYNEATKRSLDVTGGKAKNGTNVQIWTNNSTCAQKWNLTSLGNNQYRIATACNTILSLDVSAGNTNPGTNVQIWTSNNTNSQKWILTKN